MLPCVLWIVLFRVHLDHMFIKYHNIVLVAYLAYRDQRLLKHWHKKNSERYWEALRNNSPYNSSKNDSVSLKGFFDDGNPYVLLVSESEFVKLDQILEIKGNTMKLTKQP